MTCSRLVEDFQSFLFTREGDALRHACLDSMNPPEPPTPSTYAQATAMAFAAWLEGRRVDSSPERRALDVALQCLGDIAGPLYDHDMHDEENMVTEAIRIIREATGSNGQ